MRDPGAGGALCAVGGGAVGTRCVHAQADARQWRLRRDRVTPSLAAVGVAGILRIAAVQPRERTAREDGRRPDRLAPALAGRPAAAFNASGLRGEIASTP